MQCPTCDSDDTRVIDSRPADGGMAVRRRRRCEQCEDRFTTYERAVPAAQVRKRGGALQPFDPEKVRYGIDRASNGRLDDDVVGDAAAAVERGLRALGTRVVTSEQVGLEVLAQLRDLDPVAYVRFASVYRSFEDVEAFREEIERLQARPSR